MERSPELRRLVLTLGALILFVSACTASSTTTSGEATLTATASAVAEADPAPAPKGSDLYLIDPETGEAILVLRAPGWQTNAELSPDGGRAVYEGQAHGFPSQIFVLDADGTTRQLTRMKRGASDPTWSPDGTRIAFVGSRRRGGDPRPDADIFVMNADGGRIKRFAGTPQADGHPDWSPDGSRILFHSRHISIHSLPGGLIWAASVRTGAVTQLTRSHDGFAEVDPAWSPDGRWIAYSRVDSSTLNGRIYHTGLFVMRPNGTHKSSVKDAEPFHLIGNPSWSPNGRSIVFEDHRPPAVGVRWEGTVWDVGIIDVPTNRLRWSVVDTDSDRPIWGQSMILVSLPAASIG